MKASRDKQWQKHQGPKRTITNGKKKNNWHCFFRLYMKSQVWTKNVKCLRELFLWASSWVLINKMIAATRYQSCFGFWRGHLWILKPMKFCELSSFLHIAWHAGRRSCNTAMPATPSPLSFFVSFGPGANDKGSSGREGFPRRGPLVPSMGWSQRRRGFHLHRRRSGWNGSLGFFLRCKALVMRLITGEIGIPLAKVS